MQNEWDLLTAYVEVLSHFKETTVRMCTDEYPTLSLYYPLIQCLKEIVSGDYKNRKVKEFASKIADSLEVN